MPILHRFLLGFALIIAIGALQGSTTYLDVRSLVGDLGGATEIPIRTIDAAWRASDAFREADVFLHRSLDGIRDDDSGAMVERFGRLADDVDLELRRLSASDGAPAADRREREAIGNFADWRAAGLVLLGGAPATAIPSPHVLERRGDSIRAGLKALVADAQRQAATALLRIRARAAATQRSSIIFLFTGVIAGLIVAFPWALALTRPLRRLHLRMLRMVDGELDAPVEATRRSDEIGKLASALQFMRERLIERRRLETEAAVVAREQDELLEHLGVVLDGIARGDLTMHMVEGNTRYAKLHTDMNSAIGSIRNAVVTVASSTDELFGGSEVITRTTGELARRSEQQAAQLQAAVRALGDISDVVRTTADETKLASEAVSTANAEAEKAGGMMHRAAGAMGAVGSSSGRIAAIATAIDDIARQTNILALNTAIEAARAGDAGKGFAVVAIEVRALAESSAVAAEEIKSLVRQVSGDVGEGVDLLACTRDALATVLDRVGSLDAFVADLARKAEVQAEALRGVVASVSEADRAIQQNVKVGDSSAQLVKQLHDRATVLAGLVRHFQVHAA